ncbi:hypothetical protein A3D14_03725 [Candidatus Saccharibacteria bacterium RIFCSPHIGHO2_02_FULL_47_12]|nr:MAG: hypothetical protein A3D14_03725 [Candidatus Saccharibacteria bacterium RIFCSPHIGHO2_02_FULL_47_12]
MRQSNQALAASQAKDKQKARVLFVIALISFLSGSKINWLFRPGLLRTIVISLETVILLVSLLWGLILWQRAKNPSKAKQNKDQAGFMYKNVGGAAYKISLGVIFVYVFFISAWYIMIICYGVLGFRPANFLTFLVTIPPAILLGWKGLNRYISKQFKAAITYLLFFSIPLVLFIILAGK